MGNRGHTRPARTGYGGRKQLGFGGAALITSVAAHSRVCLPFGLLRAPVFWIAGILLSLISALSAQPIAARTVHWSLHHSVPDAFDSADTPFVAPHPGDEGAPSASSAAQAQQQQPAQQN